MSKYKDSYAKSPSFSTFVVSFAFAVASIGGLCVWAVTPDKPISIKKTEKIKKVEELRLLRWEKTTCPHGKVDY